MDIVNYDIISETDLRELIDAVNDKIKAGWLPLGGVTFTPPVELESGNFSDAFYLQTIVYKL
jgi:hypothetical protein